MGKILSEWLLRPGIDPLPGGPTVFWRRRSEASSGSSPQSPQSTGAPSNPDGPPQQADLPPPPDDPMRPGIDLMEQQLSEVVRKHGTGRRRKRGQDQGARSGVRPLLNYGGAHTEALSGAHAGLSVPTVGEMEDIRR